MKILAGTISVVLLAACSIMRDDATSNSVRHRYAQAPQSAAACLARNAERHSSALVAEGGAADARGHVQVVVRVKNGVLYAIADFWPVGSHAEGVLNLMVVAKSGTRQLVESLVEGC